jgi:PEP-CTERM motif
MRAKLLLVAVFAWFTVCLSAGSASALNFTADTLVGNTFSFAVGDRSASATFSFAGGNLSVTLTNTFAGDVAAPIHVLQAVFFGLTSNQTLIPVSATVAGGSTIHYETLLGNFTGAANDVSGEWAYSNKFDGPGAHPITGALQGISGVGYGLFSPSDRFNTSDSLNRSGPLAVNGANYGILSAGYTGGGNQAVTGQFPLIENSVVFTFSGADGLGLGDVSNVSFEYGTDLDFEPRDLEPIPEPATLLLVSSGLAGLAFLRAKRSPRP